MSFEGDNEIAVPRKRRPVGVTILGWVFAAGIAFLLIVGLLCLAAYALMRTFLPPGQFPPSASQFPAPFEPLLWFVKYFPLFAGAQLCLALFSIFALVAFFRLRSWSRAYFEVLNWLNLIYMLAFSAYWIHMWRAMVAMMPNPTHGSPGPPPVLMANFGTAMGIFIGLANAAIPAVLIYLLRSHFVRPAFRPQAAIQTEPSP